MAIMICRSSCEPWGGRKKTLYGLLAPSPPIRIGATGHPKRIIKEDWIREEKHREMQSGNYPILTLDGTSPKNGSDTARFTEVAVSRYRPTGPMASCAHASVIT